MYPEVWPETLTQSACALNLEWLSFESRHRGHELGVTQALITWAVIFLQCWTGALSVNQRRVESRAAGPGCRYLKTFRLSSKGLLQFYLTGGEPQVFNLCGVIIKVTDTTQFVSLPGCVTAVGVCSTTYPPPVTLPFHPLAGDLTTIHGWSRHNSSACHLHLDSGDSQQLPIQQPGAQTTQVVSVTLITTTQILNTRDGEPGWGRPEEVPWMGAKHFLSFNNQVQLPLIQPLLGYLWPAWLRVCRHLSVKFNY